MRCLSTQGSQCLPVLISIGAPLPQWVHPSLLSQPPSTPLSFPSQPPSAPLPSPSLTSPVHLCWYIPPSVHPSPLSSPGAPLPGAPLPQCTPHLSLAHPPRCTLTSRTASRYAPPRCTLPGATSPLSHSLPVHPSPVHPHLSRTSSPVHPHLSHSLPVRPSPVQPHLSHTASRCTLTSLTQPPGASLLAHAVEAVRLVATRAAGSGARPRHALVHVCKECVQ